MSNCQNKKKLIIYFFNVLMFIFEGETEHEQGRGRERGRHRIQSRLQALSLQHRARHGAWTHRPWDHDLSWSWTLLKTDWVSHAPQVWIVFDKCLHSHNYDPSQHRKHLLSIKSQKFPCARCKSCSHTQASHDLPFATVDDFLSF